MKQMVIKMLLLNIYQIRLINKKIKSNRTINKMYHNPKNKIKFKNQNNKIKLYKVNNNQLINNYSHSN